MNTNPWIFASIVAALVLVAAVLDLRTRKIPNWFTVPVFVTGLIFHTITAGFSGLGTALAGFAAGFGILLVLWLVGGGGGGDVKLMGALGAWLGATYTVVVVVLSAVFALVFTLFVIVGGVARHGYQAVRTKYFRRPGDAPQRKKKAKSEEQRMKQHTGRRLLPYALPVACGTWTILLYQMLLKTS